MWWLLKRQWNVSYKRVRTERDEKRGISLGVGGDRWNIFIHVIIA
jgi:hypothetical protein